MSKLRTSSSPNLVAYGSSSDEHYYDDSALEGVAANVKLLLKLIQDHKIACDKGKNDGRRMLRVATMVTILDSVRTRIQNSQSFGNKTTSSPQQQQQQPEQNGCAGGDDLRLLKRGIPRGKTPGEQVELDEKEKLRKQLNASMAARKSLEMMCSSLGKEKEIMAIELSKKVHEVNEMDELINDLRVQNGTLLEKIEQCCSPNKDIRYFASGREAQANGALQERNKALSEQLLRSLDGYRSMKRKLKEAQEENQVMRGTMEEMRENVSIGLEQIRGLKERTASGGVSTYDVGDEIAKLENTIESLEMQISKHELKKGECLKPKG